jgi:hypothetical protein
MKNVLQKRRQLRASFCEALSPLFLIWLLSYGYSMSDVWDFKEMNYATFSLSLPSEVTSVLNAGVVISICISVFVCVCVFLTLF